MSATSTPYGPVLSATAAKGLGSSLGIPIPSLTGGAAGGGVADSGGSNQFGNISQSGGFTSLAMLVAVLAVVYMVVKVRK